MPALTFGPFAQLAPEARAALEAATSPVAFAAGATVLREGDQAEEAYAVLRGRLRVLLGEHLAPVGTLVAPALVGELAVLDRSPRTATVVATERVEAVRIPSEALRAAVSADPAFAAELRAFADVRLANTFLRRSSPFADLPSDTVAELAAKMRAVTLAPDEVLVREGEPGDDAYLIRSGELVVTRGEGSELRQLTVLGPGALLGEVSVLTGVPRTATVRARTEVRAFRLAGDDVRLIVRRHRALVDRFESTMQSRHAPSRVKEVEVAPAPDDPNALILHDRRNGNYLRCTKEAYAIFLDLDGQRTLRDLALAHFSRTGSLDPHGVFATIATLQAAGLASTPRVAGEARGGLLPRVAELVLTPRLEFADADPLAARLYRGLWPLFTRYGTIAALAIGTVGLIAFALEFRQFPTDLGIVGFGVAYAGLLFAGIGHETAHAVATKAAGRRIGRAGMGLLYGTPVIWVDTSDAWLIDRRRRVVVNAAGPVFNYVLAGIFAIGAYFVSGTSQSVLIWLASVNLLSVVFNLSPLLEFDGYYVLSDLTNVTRLRRKALRYVFLDLVSRPRRPRTRLEIGFVAYALAAVLYVAAVTALVVAGAPRVVEGILGARFDSWFTTLASTGVSLFLVTTLLMPFVGEVRAARTGSVP